MECEKTLFIRNLPYNTTTNEELQEIFSHYGPLKACFVVTEKGSAKSRGFAYVSYTTRDNAIKAKSMVKVVNGRPVHIMFAKKRVFKNGKQEDHLNAKEEEDDDYEHQTELKIVGHTPKVSKSSYDIGRTIVITGLADDVTEKRIRVRCRKIGNIDSIEYPVPGREKDVAYVTFMKHKDARLAVKQLNNKIFQGANINVVLLSREGKVTTKSSLKKSRLIVRNISFKCKEDDLKDVFSLHGKVIDIHLPRKSNGQMLGYAFVQYTSYFEAVKAMNIINGLELKGRKVAVDWVLPKNKYQEKKEEDEKEEVEEVEEDKEVEEMEEMEEEEEDEDEEMEVEDDITKPVTMETEDVMEGKTLFIRGIPHDVDEEELNTLMQQYGPIRYCRAVMDDVTGMCRGSAFVKYRDTASVQYCLESSSCSEGLWFHGNQLDITLALSKDEIKKVKKKKASVESKDKRNLYLAKEGVILPDSEVAKDLTKHELAKRMRSFEERRRKLRNPFYFMSKNRLSVRNLPVNINEKKLRVLFKSHGGDNAFIKQVKLMRSKDKFDDNGLGKPLGFGFVEFTQHEPALRALRSLNNNPDIFGPHKRPMVEFAVEDTRALKLMNRRQQHQAAKSSDIQLTNKRVKWQLKCKAKRLRRRAAGKTSNEKNIKTQPVRIMERPFIKKTMRQRKLQTEPRMKIRKTTKTSKCDQKTEKEFSNLVNQYRNRLFSQETRWFE